MKNVLLCLSSAAVLFAAGADAAPATTGAVQAAPDFDAVSMRRSACYGSCPVYSIRIEANGDVTFTGEKYVRVKGVHKSTISRDDVARLAAAFRQAQFATLRDKYAEELKSCVIFTTDNPSVVISLDRAGKTKTVTYDYGCAGPDVPSKAIENLSTTIDTVAGSASLISR
ncbi:MAG: DUF6438 domain-containing protein [Massilia sp.]